jgi:DNA repair exonuclease SbcCD ATPase subunit
MAQVSSTEGRVGRRAQFDRLTACDEDLSRIATDVTELSGELTRLRMEGEELARLLAERGELLTRQRKAIAALEEERTRWRQQTEAAVSMSATAESRLAQREQQAATVGRELHTLRATIQERERRLAQAEVELAAARDALSASEQALEQKRAEAEPLPEDPIPGHVLVVGQPAGYRLVVSDDPCPRVGDKVDVEGRPFVTARVGHSPLPGDKRPCAFLLPEPK